MNPYDWAVVVGIRRYWDAPAGWITNLNGPDNDAAAVAQWLQQPEGGGLPADHVRIVRSAGLPDPFPNERAVGPRQQAVVGALNDIAELEATAFEGQYAGRRLYIYVTGHGFANDLGEAALVTAEAKFGRPLNVLVSSWLKWLWKAARFKEYVLWVDTCATRTPGTYLQPCDRTDSISLNAAQGKLFTAFAARFDMRAVENQMPDGAWHGAFTYALLYGLNGGARTPVTTSTLRDYLTNTMSTFMRDDQLKSDLVDKEPAFVYTDELVFGNAAASRFTVSLRFPASWVSKRVTISTGTTSPRIAETWLETAEWTPELEPGIYVVHAPDCGDFFPFQVSGDGQHVTIP